jgi:hypothetical protein
LGQERHLRQLVARRAKAARRLKNTCPTALLKLSELEAAKPLFKTRKRSKR